MDIPAFLYGTAWKEDRTEELTGVALAAGFRGVDTANQRRHYFEAGAGAAIAASGIPRGELFLQTKFTYARGQDHRLPYDPRADLPTQVAQSFASSLEHLHTDYVDSYVLHGPATGAGLVDADWQVWEAMESLHRAGKARALGVSNVSLEQLTELAGGASVAPSFVQNRCYAADGWDDDVREYCRDAAITYQGFSLLTANRRELASEPLRRIASRTGATIPQVVFRFAIAVGMLPLTGTSSRTHMAQDLAAAAVTLTEDDVRAIEDVASHTARR